ncbi:MAG: response regulator [Acidobacteriota bacterium]|nr:response regulator [Acidobacteriota bacterium]
MSTELAAPLDLLVAPVGEDVPPTILVVDDFEDTRWLLRTWLERRGFRVIEAENGMEAISEAQTGAPDLIIMDLEMPELDGLEATRQIREVEKLASVPIVAVSAYGADQFREPALRAGCNEYVSTPFEPAELERLIRSYLH